MAVRGVNHIGIAVEDIDKALVLYRDQLGMRLMGIETLPDRGLKVAFLDGGGVEIELLQSIQPDTTIARFIEKRGPGIHHVALEVEDIQAHLDALDASGVQLVDRTPRPGAQGSSTAFLHPRSAGGVLLELMTPGKPPAE